MCKHILNAKIFIQAPCCNGWFECSECHDEVNDHMMTFSKLMKMTCKACSRCFDRDLSLFTEKDKCCSNCGILWCIPGETPESRMTDESLSALSSYMDALCDTQHQNFDIKPR